jgi:hypothetical protein
LNRGRENIVSFGWTTWSLLVEKEWNMRLTPFGLPASHDIARGTDSQFTTNSKRNLIPVWSPDSSRIVFASDGDGIPSVYQKAANGVTPEQPLDKDGRGMRQQ